MSEHPQKKKSILKNVLIGIGILILIGIIGNALKGGNNKPSENTVKKDDKIETPIKEKENKSSTNKTILKDLIGSPSKDWIGKTLSINFGDRWGKSLANLNITVKLQSVEIDEDGFKFFKVDKVYTDQGHDYLYFSWFDASSNPHLLSWKEVISQ